MPKADRLTKCSMEYNHHFFEGAPTLWARAPAEDAPRVSVVSIASATRIESSELKHATLAAEAGPGQHFDVKTR